MRPLLLFAAAVLIVASPDAARGQGVQRAMGVSARVLAPEEVRVADAVGAEGVRVERVRGGGTRLSVPLVLTHRVRPTVTLQQRAGDPACELVSAPGSARTEAGWSTSLRCTAPAGGADAPSWARIVIVPST
jgi:hypothetical protein